MVGIKVREQAPLIVADNGLEPVRRAVARRATQAGVPVMVHIGGRSLSGLGELLDLLRPGDSITPLATPWRQWNCRGRQIDPRGTEDALGA